MRNRPYLSPNFSRRGVLQGGSCGRIYSRIAFAAARSERAGAGARQRSLGSPDCSVFAAQPGLLSRSGSRL